ncbi:uncharacterized protein DUF955 [Naumannella halotolerans]|uniref:Uncharacterized protein DUF955 n=1 Tax=Naumannella halotolerans TaxID=993414 RepID=A0A4R7J1V5_9ACTN|nr:uncharacterized protein DUF955 [Naumannella halotolerans]
MADRPGGDRALTYDPGRDAAERYPDWVIRHRPLGGIPEVLCRRRKVILIDRAQGWPAKRSALAHALAHLDLGHTGHHALDDLNEHEAELLAARRLIPLDHLVDAVLWAGECWAEVADQLTVDLRLLRHRCDHLHPSERHAIKRHLANHRLGQTA